MVNSPPLLRYFGGKYRDANKIIAQFVDHELYCEPYGGGAAVLLQKQPSAIEVYNDLSGEVVNFFKVLRDRNEELKKGIELTPYSREEWEKAFNWKGDDELERARKLYVRSWMSRGGGIDKKNGGWRFIYQYNCGKSDPLKAFNRVDHIELLAKRLKQVYVEHDDAIAVIKRYGRNKRGLIYCDPPYLHGTRTEKDNYLHEMCDRDHEELAETLHSINAMSLISGYDSSLYRSLYKDWQLIQWETKSNAAKGFKQEFLWVCPAIANKQLPLLQLLQP